MVFSNSFFEPSNWENRNLKPFLMSLYIFFKSAWQSVLCVEKRPGLYLDYAIQAFYDGLTLLISTIMVAELGGMDHRSLACKKKHHWCGSNFENGMFMQKWIDNLAMVLYMTKKLIRTTYLMTYYSNCKNLVLKLVDSHLYDCPCCWILRFISKILVGKKSTWGPTTKRVSDKFGMYCKD